MFILLRSDSNSRSTTPAWKPLGLLFVITSYKAGTERCLRHYLAEDLPWMAPRITETRIQQERYRKPASFRRPCRCAGERPGVVVQRLERQVWERDNHEALGEALESVRLLTFPRISFQTNQLGRCTYRTGDPILHLPIWVATMRKHKTNTLMFLI